MPVTRLLQTIQIIHARAGSIKSEPPVFLRSEWKRILSIEEDEPLGREFLVVIAGEVQRKFGDKRQHASQPVGAETICVHTVAGGGADFKQMFLLERIFQQDAPPKQMRDSFHGSVIVETVAVRLAAKLRLMPQGKFQRQRLGQARLLPAAAQSRADVE